MTKRNTIYIVSGVVLVGIVGFVLSQKYHWFNVKPITPPVTPVAIIKRSQSPKGKMPWAVGDVSLWDDEDPSYCGNCAGVCNTTFSEGRSTECDMCMSKCPGVRND